MAGITRKFEQRAPRYTLRPKDNRFMRFAHLGEEGQSYTTQFIDISTTGLAFIIDKASAPAISDMIKIEVPLDDGNSVAWWARVVRIEEYVNNRWSAKPDDYANGTEYLVGVAFHELPAGHRHQIHQTLEKKFIEVSKEQREQLYSNWIEFTASRIWQFILYGFCIAFTFWLLWYISRPNENYDAKYGAPWGQRYQWLNFFSPPAEKIPVPPPTTPGNPEN